jgi:predicted dehydrogenase
MMNLARRPTRLGVLGTGAVSQIVHMPILTDREDVEVVAVSDTDIPKAKAIAARFGVKRVLSDQDLLEGDMVDGVVISTPNHMHEEQAMAALRAGKHVLVERPLALTAKGVDRLLKTARKANKVLMAGMSHRYRPDAAALSAFVAGGELGDIHQVRGSWLNRKLHLNRPTWRQNKALSGGGALMDLGVPALDLCLYMVGYPQIKRVSAALSYGEWEVEDSAVVMAHTDKGLVVTVEVTWSFYGNEDRQFFRVMGSDGSGSLPPLQVFKQLGGRPLDATPHQPVPRVQENPYHAAYRREIDLYVRAIAGERDVPLPQEQYALMSIIEAAYRSAAKGREVDV